MENATISRRQKYTHLGLCNLIVFASKHKFGSIYQALSAQKEGYLTIQLSLTSRQAVKQGRRTKGGITSIFKKHWVRGNTSLDKIRQARQELAELGFFEIEKIPANTAQTCVLYNINLVALSIYHEQLESYLAIHDNYAIEDCPSIDRGFFKDFNILTELYYRRKDDGTKETYLLANGQYEEGLKLFEKLYRPKKVSPEIIKSQKYSKTRKKARVKSGMTEIKALNLPY